MAKTNFGGVIGVNIDTGVLRTPVSRGSFFDPMGPLGTYNIIDFPLSLETFERELNTSPDADPMWYAGPPTRVWGGMGE